MSRPPTPAQYFGNAPDHRPVTAMALVAAGIALTALYTAAPLLAVVIALALGFGAGYATGHRA